MAMPIPSPISSSQKLATEMSHLAQEAPNPVMEQKILTIVKQLQSDEKKTKALIHLSKAFNYEDLKNNAQFQKALCLFLKNHPGRSKRRVVKLLGKTTHEIPTFLLKLQSESYAMIFEDLHHAKGFIPRGETLEVDARETFYQCLETVSSEGKLTPENVLDIWHIAHREGATWLEADCVAYIKQNLLKPENAFQWLRHALTYSNQTLLLSCIKLLADRFLEAPSKFATPIRSMMDWQRPWQGEIDKLITSHHYGILDYIFNRNRYNIPGVDIKVTEKGIEAKFVNVDWVWVKYRDQLKKILLNSGTNLNLRIPLYVQIENPFSPISNSNLILVQDLLATPNSNIASLDLSYLIIEDEARIIAEALKKNRSLQTLNLSNCRLGPVGGRLIIEALSNDLPLTELNLDTNNLDLATIQILAEKLKTNRTLQKLSLYGNYGTDAEAAVHGKGSAMRDMLRQNRGLTSLNLGSTNLKATDVEMIAEGLRENPTVRDLILSSNLLGGRQEAIDAVDHLLRNSRLSSLSLQGANIVMKENENYQVKALIETLKSHPTLQELNLADHGIRSKHALALAHALSENPHLRTLNFSSFESLRVDVVTALMENPHLRSLVLHRRSIDYEGIKAVCDALKGQSQITSLSIEFELGGALDINALREAIRNNKKLEVLEMKIPVDVIVTAEYFKPLIIEAERRSPPLSLQITTFYDQVDREIEQIRQEARRQFGR